MATRTFLLALLGWCSLVLQGCQPNPESSMPPASTPVGAADAGGLAPREPQPSPGPGGSFRGPLVADPFPSATLTTAQGQALLWSPWPMEGRDPQRSGRSATVGVDQPRLLWSVPVDPPSFSQPIFASDGSIYLGSVSGTLPAVGADGRRLWTFSAPGPLPSPAIGPDGGVYVRAGDGALHALHPDGRRRWTTEIGAQPLRLGPAPVVGPDRYVYLASYHSTLVYLVQPGGFIQWAYNVHARLPGAVALAPDGTIYLGAADGKVRAMDREMVQRWIFDAGAPIASAPALGPDGTLYVLVGEQPRALLALDASGAKRWSVEACWSPGAQALWPSVAADGRAQVANCSVRPDGTTAWRAAGAGSSATPAALDADGNAYFASGSTLYSVRPDGTPRWSYQAEGEVGPPSLGTFGTIAFTTSGPDRLHLLGR